MDERLIPFRHNAWATGVLLERCRELPEEAFGRRFEIGLGSLHDTLLHIVAAMRRWADRISERPLRPSLQSDGALRTPQEMLALLEEAAADLEAVALSIWASGRAQEIMSFPDPGGGEPFRFHRATALAHATTHGMHHRAQALNMLRHLAVNPLPEIDVIDWELSEGWR